MAYQRNCIDSDRTWLNLILKEDIMDLRDKQKNTEFFSWMNLLMVVTIVLAFANIVFASRSIALITTVSAIMLFVSFTAHFLKFRKWPSLIIAAIWFVLAIFFCKVTIVMW